MEVHQTTFVQAVALAGVVALSMTGWEKSREETRVQAGGTPARTAATQTGVKGSYIVAATRKVEGQP
ncbi:MAG TPA: hypothetical protein VLV56_12425 [Burkholderiales bacterium]|nr:hypothetical protein [Burkholderiales bacterium]